MKANIIFLLLVVGTDSSSTALAQSPGTFTATGNMTTRRIFHTATLLADGRVLVAGGEMLEAPTPGGFFKTQSSAELYDPRTGTFSATGNMTRPRSLHTATLLPNGKVLIAGGGLSENGTLGNPALASVELYDPGTGTFSLTGEMSAARSGPTATLLNNGKVLLASGFYREPGCVCVPLYTELYDPDNGTFSVSGSMKSPWTDTATLLPSGKVLVTRGDPQGIGPGVSSAEVYDPSTGTFTPAGYATTNHTGPTATLLMNGKVLVAGGDVGDGDGSSFIAEYYDPATGAFSKTGGMTAGRLQHSATLLPDGGVLFAGGHNNSPASAEIYDPLKGTFSRTASMSLGRELHTATLLNDGRVLIAGGNDQRYWIPETILSSAQLYTPAVLIPAPLLRSLSTDGRGQGAILHANTAQVATSGNPAVGGEALEIYSTGLGDGGQIPPQVSIGGRMAEVLWFGNAPGYSGLNQINVRVPGGVTPGPAVPVRLTYIGRPSNEVSIGVR